MFTYYYMALSYDAYLPITICVDSVPQPTHTSSVIMGVISLAITQTSQLHIILIIISSILSLQVRSPTTDTFAIDDLLCVDRSIYYSIEYLSPLSSPTTIVSPFHPFFYL
jgi:hypothetical protein